MSRTFTEAEIDAMIREAESQGMAPSAAKDAASEAQGGTGFMRGFTGAMERTGLGLEQAKTYATGTDADREGINAQIRAHEAEMAQGGPSGAIGNMAGTAAQFMGPQGVGSAVAKVAPRALVQGAHLYLGKPGSVLRSAAQGGAYEATQPVSPSDASTDEYLKGKGVQIGAGTAVGAAAGAVGKVLTREGVPIPPERQKMVTEAELYKMPLTPGERTGYKRFLEAEMGFKSKAGSAPLMLKPADTRQAILNQEAAKAIGSQEEAPTESVLALQREIATKGYAPIAAIPKMSWDTAYMTELDKLADKQMRRVGGSTDVVGVITRLKTGAGKLTGDDFLQELQTVRNMSFDAKKNGQSATARQLQELGKVMEDFAERRVGILAKKGLVAPDAMAQLRTARTELSKIHAIEESVDPVTGQMNANKYLTKELKRNPASAGVSMSPASQGLADVGAVARIIRQANPGGPASAYGNLMAGRELQSAVTGPLTALTHAGPIAKNYLAAKYYLKYGGTPGLLTDHLTPNQNMAVRRLLPGMTFATQEGLTE